VTTRVAAWLHAVRARPWHAGVAALAAGLATGPRSGIAVAAAAVIASLLGRRGAVRLGLVVLVLAGATFAHARVQAQDATRLGPRIGHAVRAEVVLLEAPRERSFGARVATVGLEGERVLLRARRDVRWPVAPIGAVLAVRGGLEALPEREAWLRARGVHAQVRAESMSDTGRRRGGIAGVVDRVRARADAALQTGVPTSAGGLLRGMVLGEDAALSEPVADSFRTSGLSHLVAASGQNVTLLAILALAAGSALGLGFRLRLGLVLSLIAFYVPLAGSGPSIQRAGIMGAAGVGAILAGRPAARWHALLLAVVVTLALNPRADEDVGWQLSFAAVLAILVLAPRLRDGLDRRGLPTAMAEAVALTVAATLGTAPLIALQFGRTSLVSLPANVLAAPAVAPVMWLGMLAAAAGQVAIAPAGALTALAAVPAGYLVWLAETVSRLPGAQARLPAALVFAACLGAALAVVTRRRRGTVLAGATAVLVAAAVILRHADGALAAPTGLRITFLDVGQGDATLVQDRDRAILVDTGPPDGPVLARLRHAGVRRLDLLVVTHAQDDHDGAAAAVVRALPVGMVLDGRDGLREPSGIRMAAAAASRHVRLVAPAAGEVLRVGPILVRVLWPTPRPSGPPTGDDPNQRAIVACVDAGGVRTLLTADAESDVLGQLEVGPIDILKVSHHGSADEGLPELLERLRPRLAAIEVGRHNRYGHPAPTTVAALAAAGARVVRTDRDASIMVEPSNGALRVQAHA
jgi:competence protein ComEC